MAGLLDMLFGGQPQQSPYSWMPPEQENKGLLGGLLGNLQNNKYQMAGYLSGALMPGSTQEQIARGLQGMVAGSQSDLLMQQRLDGLKNQREQRGSAASLIDQEVKAGKMSPQDARFFAGNPEAWKEYSKARFGATPPVFAPDGTVFQPQPFGRLSSPGGVPISERMETINPDGSKSPAFAVKPSLTNPSGGIVQPGMPAQQPMPQPAAPSTQPRAPVQSSSRVVGDAEGVNRGLYDRPITAQSPQAIEEAQGLGKTLAGQYKTILDEGNAASKMRTNLQRMKQLSDKAYEGAAAPVVQMVRSTLATFGIDPGKVPAGEEFSALSHKMVLDAQNGSLGAGVSNADVGFIAATNPNMSHTKAGRREIIETQEALASRRIEIARMAGDYRRKNGTLDGFDSYIADWAEKNPLFKGRENVATMQDRFNASGASTAGSAWQEVAPGVRFRQVR